MKWANCFAAFSLAVLLSMPTGASQHCVVSTQGLNFGVYQAFDPAPQSAQANIELVCESVVPFQISLDAGLYASGDLRDRRMQGEQGGSLRYNLYLDAAASQVWGDGSAGTSVFSGVSDGGASLAVVHGRLPPQQLVQPGAYHDNVVITVAF